jgi:hypothetical protein
VHVLRFESTCYNANELRGRIKGCSHLWGRPLLIGCHAGRVDGCSHPGPAHSAGRC